MTLPSGKLTVCYRQLPLISLIYLWNMVMLVIFHGFLYVFQRVSQLWWFQINPTWATWDAEDGTPSTSRKITRSGKRSSVTMASQEGFTGGVFSILLFFECLFAACKGDKSKKSLNHCGPSIAVHEGFITWPTEMAKVASSVHEWSLNLQDDTALFYLALIFRCFKLQNRNILNSMIFLNLSVQSYCKMFRFGHPEWCSESSSGCWSQPSAVNWVRQILFLWIYNSSWTRRRNQSPKEPIVPSFCADSSASRMAAWPVGGVQRGLPAATIERDIYIYIIV